MKSFLKQIKLQATSVEQIKANYVFTFIHGGVGRFSLNAWVKKYLPFPYFV